MKFYHVTTHRRWKQIQEDGELFGVSPGWDGWSRANRDRDGRMRYTYLAPRECIWTNMGNVLLEVEFEPKREDFGKRHNYGFDPPPGEICIQFCVFEPIPLSKVRLIGYKNNKGEFPWGRLDE